MNVELTRKEFRLLLDMVYVGNWVLNSTRGFDRFEEYDALESKLFSLCAQSGMPSLARKAGEIFRASKAYEDGGIHEAIADYEDAVFFEILAEELARRDMSGEDINPDNIGELTERIDEYISEFEKNGIDNITIDMT